jgi:hypothetical protein
MAECQSRRVEGLTGSGLFQQTGVPPLDAGDPPAAATGVYRVPHYRVPHVFQVDPDLVGAAGMELQAEQIHHVESGDYEGIGPGGPAP